MHDTQTFAYSGVGNTQKVRYGNHNPRIYGHLFKGREVFINLIGFMLGRAIILSGMAPFGIAYYAASYMGSASSVILGVTVILGLMTAGIGLMSVKYIIAMLIFTAVYTLNRSQFLKTRFFVALTTLVSMLAAGLIPVVAEGLLLYDVLMLLFESFISFVMVFIFSTGIPVLKQRVERRVLSNEEIISLSILMGLFIVGFTDIGFPGNVSLRSILCILIVLIFSLKNGAAIAASTGVTIGLINSVSSPMMPLLVGSYAFCGLISGVFKSFGKWGVSLGFILANAIFTIYVNGSTEILINIYDIFIAVAILSVLPTKALDYVGEFLSKSSEKFADRKAYSRKMKNMMVDKLDNIAKSFEQLASTFNNIAQKKVSLQNNDVTVLFDQVADRICKDCSLCLCCWEREFHNTYQTMFSILEKLEEKGRIEERDVPQTFVKRCMRIDDFIDAMNNMFEIYQLNLVWYNKVGESRGLVSQQLQGVSKIIANLAQEISVDLHFDEEMEKNLILELDKAGVTAKDVTVMLSANGKYEIDVIYKSCGGTRKCVKNAASVISKVIGRKMVKESATCTANTWDSKCSVKYVEEETYQVSTGIARVRKEGQTMCGDNYSFMQLKDGKYVLALSDGMGSGNRAARESSATIALLEQFLESGFDKDTAVKLINSVLVLKSPDESFATIDLSAVDLYTGSVEFAKIGSATTFIKKKERVEAIKSTSLPIGILENIDVEISSRTVSDGDFIIMMTDGVLDSKKEIVKKENWVKELLMEMDTTNPQEIADRLLQAALENAGNAVEDDMTVLVAKVWKKIR